MGWGIELVELVERMGDYGDGGYWRWDGWMWLRLMEGRGGLILIVESMWVLIIIFILPRSRTSSKGSIKFALAPRTCGDNQFWGRSGPPPNSCLEMSISAGHDQNFSCR